jgi:hypothetical protein
VNFYGLGFGFTDPNIAELNKWLEDETGRRGTNTYRHLSLIVIIAKYLQRRVDLTHLLRVKIH